MSTFVGVGIFLSLVFSNTMAAENVDGESIWSLGATLTIVMMLSQIAYLCDKLLSKGPSIVTVRVFFADYYQ